MQRRQTQLVQLVKRCSLHGNPNTNEGVVDDIPSISLSSILPWTPDSQVPHVGQRFEGVDKTRHVCGGMEQRRILLRQNITQFRVGILAASEHRAHARMGRVQETYLLASERVDQGR